MSDPLADLSQCSLLELFRMEVETHAAVLNENLLALETQFRNDAPPQASEGGLLLESLMRAAHSIKGAARTVQIEVAVQLAHVMEDCFQAAMGQQLSLQSNHIDILLDGVDSFLQLTQVEESQFTVWLAEAQPTIQARIQAITAFLQPSLPSHHHPTQQNFPTNESDPALSNEALTYLPISFDHPVSEDSPEEIDLAISIDRPIAAADEVKRSSLLDHSAPLSNTHDLTATIVSSLEQLQHPPAALSKNERFVRVSSDNLNQLMGLAGESLIAANWLEPFADSFIQLKKEQLQLTHLLHQLQDKVVLNPSTRDLHDIIKQLQQKEQECREFLNQRQNELEIYARRSANLSDRLYREVIAAHMCPFGEGVKGFPRLVRDLSRKLNKPVKLEIIGQSTPVDRDILNKLEAPLLHILYNAIDHGIESPQERLMAGKPSEGRIRIETSHHSGMLSISITDDGRGISMEQLRAMIIRKKLVAPGMTTQLTESELMEFLFLPGFSTSEQVTELSGRGIGLNIAKSMAQEVGGQVQATSKPGHGLTLNFQLPLTLSVIRTLLVEVGGEPYAFPLAQIDQVLTLDKSDIAWVEHRPYTYVNNLNIALVAAKHIFEIDPTSKLPSPCRVIIIRDSHNSYGLIIDHFLGERDLVVRPLDPGLGKIQDISAAALMEDGSPVLIIDIPDLIRSIERHLMTPFPTPKPEISSQAPVPILTRPTPTAKRILIVDDSVTVREMECQLLKNQGYHVDVAADGLEGWYAVRTGNYDLIISDIDMPRMDGLRLVEHIKSHSQLSSTPVILVTYKDSEKDRLRGLQAGADCYLTKSSFHDDTLISTVFKLVGP